MTRLAHPWFLLLLAVVGAVLFVYIYRQRHKRGSIKYSDVGTLKKIPRAPLLKYRHSLIVLRLLVLCLLILGLARPQLGRQESEIITKGVDIILCLDVSHSMNNEDFKPRNRKKHNATVTLPRWWSTWKEMYGSSWRSVGVPAASLARFPTACKTVNGSNSRIGLTLTCGGCC